MKNIICHYYTKIIHVIVYSKYLNWLRKLLLSVLGDYKFYKIISHADTLPLLGAYCKEGKKSNNVVMMFDGKADQPGLADCIRGITTCYHIAKSKNRTFRINYAFPFCLDGYLEPNNVDWRIRSNELCFDAEYAKPIVCTSYNSIFGDNNSEIQKRYIEDMLDTYTDKEIHLYSNAYSYDSTFYEDFNELFKPSLRIKNLINDNLEKIGGRYISVSFRFANLLGDLQDTFGKKLKDKEAELLMDKCIDSLNDLYKLNPSYSKILVTTDSITFIQRLKQLNYVYLIPGEIGHLAHDGDDSVVVKTFLDLFLISRADHVYMMRTDIMYRSGFAKRAALIGNKPFSEILVK